MSLIQKVKIELGDFQRFLNIVRFQFLSFFTSVLKMHIFSMYIMFMHKYTYLHTVFMHKYLHSVIWLYEYCNVFFLEETSNAQFG